MRLLVEGGAAVHAAFGKWADRLEIFRGPSRLGHGIRSTVDPQLNRFTHVATRRFGPDLLESFTAKA